MRTPAFSPERLTYSSAYRSVRRHAAPRRRPSRAQATVDLEHLARAQALFVPCHSGGRDPLGSSAHSSAAARCTARQLGTQLGSSAHSSAAWHTARQQLGAQLSSWAHSSAAPHTAPKSVCMCSQPSWQKRSQSIWAVAMTLTFVLKCVQPHGRA